MEPFTASLLFERILRHFFVDLNKAVIFLLFSCKQLYKERTGNTQRFIDPLIHLICFFLAFGKQCPSGTSNRPGRNDQERDHDDPYDRQFPAHRKKSNQSRHDSRNITYNTLKGS